MTFLSILLTLFIDRVLWNDNKQRSAKWFTSYQHKLTSLAAWIKDNKHAAAIILLPILALVGWLQFTLIPSFGALLELTFGTLILLYTLGPRDLANDVEKYLNARNTDNSEQAEKYAALFNSSPIFSSNKNQTEQVVDGILLSACQRLIGPIFWFIVFGASGAVAYRLVYVVYQNANADTESSPIADSARQLRWIFDWAPARITAAGHAIAGNFDAVASAWKTSELLDENDKANEADRLLIETGRAALGHRERVSHAFIEDSLALVWRNLTLWMALLGLGNLFSIL